jgi:hypothetical protein
VHIGLYTVYAHYRHFELFANPIVFHSNIEAREASDIMATTSEATTTAGPTLKEVNGAGTGVNHGSDRIEKDHTLSHTATNISLSPELFEKVTRYTPIWSPPRY